MKNRYLLLMLGILYFANPARSQHFPDSVIVKAFWQGAEVPGAGNTAVTNCASISVIKGAIQFFGLDSVVRSSYRNNAGYTVTLRSGKIIDITDDELASMRQIDGFMFTEADNPILVKARFYYAVMAKHKQLLNPGVYPSIESAASYRLHGVRFCQLIADTKENIRLLGIEANCRNQLSFRVNPLQLQGIILTNKRHSAYSSFGRYDEYGNFISNDQFVPNHSGFVSRIFGGHQINGIFVFSR